MSAELVAELEALRTPLAEVRLPLPDAGADTARRDTAYVVGQLDDYVLPRLRDLDAPLLAVVGGSTGSGKSTLVNALAGRPITTPGVLRPTTRHPVLACHPDDLGWFVDDRILPRLPRITGDTAGTAGAEDVYGVRLVADPVVPIGLGVLDAPDLDSVAHANRDLAGLLMAAADLWLFVTTASRYADAVPWAALRAAVARNAAVVIVLNRVPPEAFDDVTAHVRSLLESEGLASAPLFVLPEVALTDGMLPPTVVADLRDWLFALVADAGTRVAVARRTLDGAVADLLGRVPVIADAADAQLAAAQRLRTAAQVPYDQACTVLTDSSADNAIMRGEVLARWQEFVGTGEALKKLETGVGRLRDRVSAAMRGDPAPPERVSEAIESRLASMIVASAHDAARQADGAWRADPAGRALLAGDDLGRASADIDAKAAEVVRSWQDDVIALIRSEGADKRQTARLAAFGVNGAAAALMIAVFSTTGGLTGAEIGIAGASTVLAQKVLEAVFGEGAVRRLSVIAREALDERVTALMMAERARFDDRVASLDLDPEVPARLRVRAQSAAAVAAAESSADGVWPVFGAVVDHGAPAAGDAGPVKPRLRDRMKRWWYAGADDA